MLHIGLRVWREGSPSLFEPKGLQIAWGLQMDDDSESVLTGVGSVVPSNASGQGLFSVFGSDDLEI